MPSSVEATCSIQRLRRILGSLARIQQQPRISLPKRHTYTLEPQVEDRPRRQNANHIALSAPLPTASMLSRVNVNGHSKTSVREWSMQRPLHPPSAARRFWRGFVVDYRNVANRDSVGGALGGAYGEVRAWFLPSTDLMESGAIAISLLLGFGMTRADQEELHHCAHVGPQHKVASPLGT